MQIVKSFRYLPLSGILLCFSLQSFAQAVLVEDGYVQALPSTVQNTSAYMRITNNSETSLVLTGAGSPLARSVMLHETRDTNGMMSMEHVMSVELAPGETVNLQPGGLHVMLMGLTRPLQEGDIVEVSLHFRDSDDLLLQLPVRRLGGTQQHHHH